MAKKKIIKPRPNQSQQKKPQNVSEATPTAKLSKRAWMKSKIFFMRDAMVSVKEVYVRFCNETSIHGLKHTVAENLHWTERCLWFALTAGAFYGAVYCGLAQLSRYTKEPVVVSMQRDFRSWWTTFPAVTACFMDRLEVDKAKEVIEENWNITEESNPDKYQYYLTFIELIADVSFRTNLQQFWKYQDDETLASLDLLKLALSVQATVHPTFPLNVMVSKIDKEVQWVPVMTEMGICMTFNSEYSEFQFLMQNVDWTEEDLLRCHYHSGQCYVRVDSVNNPVRYFIHSPFDVPSAISNPTGEVNPGEELVMDFKVVEIRASEGVRHLTPEQRRCKYPDERLSDSIRAYSFGLCQMHCRNRMALMFCGCRPYFYIKGDGKVCDTSGMACIGRNVEILINLPKNLAKCSCLPQCAELNYYSHTKKIVIRYEFQCLLYLGMEVEKPAKCESGSRTKASLGGTTALFVGASVLTVVETVLFVFRLLINPTGAARRPKEFKFLP
ncbi:unnamed protein product [Plutella xylostella]|uniref:(diamondback moth) hypothetical protein n=1 Tax=Plutella xylostella TaxID=51655 RepID=A0A8S4G3K4_PLUXY|nr:unnamed protein product [Plutella xylostella]